MGTRSLTHIQNEDEDTLITLYRQHDGSFENYGLDLAKYLSRFEMVNGIPVGTTEYDELANGAGCLSAQVISEFKEGVGGYYVYPANSKDCGEEYTYTVTATEDMQIFIKAKNHYDNSLNFEGTPSDYIEKFDT